MILGGEIEESSAPRRVVIAGVVVPSDLGEYLSIRLRVGRFHGTWMEGDGCVIIFETEFESSAIRDGVVTGDQLDWCCALRRLWWRGTRELITIRLRVSVG